MDAPKPARTSSVWPDFAAFAAGIVFAAFDGWDTRHLVWSLWLASLVIGYALIVTSIIRLLLPSAGPSPPPPAGWEKAPIGQGFTVGGLFLGLFLLAFFTFHFGGFHYGHSVFLNVFFPIDGSTQNLRATSLPDAADYLAVLKQNWWFVLLAFVAQRAAFRPAPAAHASIPGHKAKHPLESGILAPYKNVVRLHLLIFFFAFAHVLKLPGVLIYLVVYTVYFLPVWPKKKSAARPDHGA